MLISRPKPTTCLRRHLNRSKAVRSTARRSHRTTQNTKNASKRPSISVTSKPPNKTHFDTSNPLNLLHKRQLHPVHIYGSSGRPVPNFEKAPLPADPLILTEFLPTHIQYISGYQFLPINNVNAVKKTLQTSLSKFDVLGRIYIHEQGINLQMCSHPSKTQQVISAMRNLENGLFLNTRIFANDVVDTATVPPLFDKLAILERPILNDGLTPEYSAKLTEYIEQVNHLDAQEWHEALVQADKTDHIKDKPIILDIRNLYENELGAFKHSIAVDVDAYRDTFHIVDTILSIKHPEGKEPYAEPTKQANGASGVGMIQRSKPQRGDLHPITKNNHRFEAHHQQQTIAIGEKLRKIYGNPGTSAQFDASDLAHNKPDVADADLSADKPIVGIDKKHKIMIFCTGGIRCLKVGAYLKQQGFEDVNTLNGGVNAYSVYAQNNLTPEESQFNGSNVVFDHRRAVKVGQAVLSHCHQCGTPTDIQQNCENELCDILHLQCQSCAEDYNGTCSVQCSEEKFGLGDWTRQMLKNRGIRPIATPPSKNRIRPRIQPYSITQHAPFLNNLDIINADVEQQQQQQQQQQQHTLMSN